MTSQAIQTSAAVSVTTEPVISSSSSKEVVYEQVKTTTPGNEALLGTIQALSAVTDSLSSSENADSVLLNREDAPNSSRKYSEDNPDGDSDGGDTDDDTSSDSSSFSTVKPSTGLIGGSAVGLAALSLLDEQECLLNIALNSIDMSVISNNFATDYALTSQELAQDSADDAWSAGMDQAYAEYTTCATSGFSAVSTAGMTMGTKYFGQMKSANDEQEANNQLLQALDAKSPPKAPTNPEFVEKDPSRVGTDRDFAAAKAERLSDFKESIKYTPKTATEDAKIEISHDVLKKHQINEDGTRYELNTDGSVKSVSTEKDPEFLVAEKEIRIKTDLAENNGKLTKDTADKYGLDENGIVRDDTKLPISHKYIGEVEAPTNGVKDPHVAARQRQILFKKEMEANGGKLTKKTAQENGVDTDGHILTRIKYESAKTDTYTGWAKNKLGIKERTDVTDPDFAIAKYEYNQDKIAAIQANMAPHTSGRFSDDSPTTKELIQKYGTDEGTVRTQRKLDFKKDEVAQHAVYEMVHGNPTTGKAPMTNEALAKVKERLEGFNKVASDKFSIAQQGLTQTTSLIRELTSTVNSGLGGMWQTLKTESEKEAAYANSDKGLLDAMQQSMLTNVGTQNGLNNTYFGQAMSIMGSQLDALRRANSGA